MPMVDAMMLVLRVDLQPERWVDDAAAAATYYEHAFGSVVEHRVPLTPTALSSYR
jgi:hypothetical protein